MNYTLEDIKKQSPYPIGELNTAYAKYFVGNSYLYPINSEEYIFLMSLLNQVAEITGIFIMVPDRFYYARVEEAITRNGENLLRNSM